MTVVVLAGRVTLLTLAPPDEVAKMAVAAGEDERVMVMAEVSVVGLPLASSSVTVKAWVAVVPRAAEMAGGGITNWVATPGTPDSTLMLLDVVVLVVRPVVVAVMVNVPMPPVKAQPANVATPATAVTGLVVQPKESVPVVDRVTELVADVTTLPLVSSMDTTGWTVKAEPLIAATGCVVTTSLVADEVEYAVVRPVAVAVSQPVVPRIDFRLVSVQPVKDATPAVAALAAQPVTLPTDPPMVIMFVAEVTTFPPASSTLTVGWVVNVPLATGVPLQVWLPRSHKWVGP